MSLRLDRSLGVLLIRARRAKNKSLPGLYNSDELKTLLLLNFDISKSMIRQTGCRRATRELTAAYIHHLSS